jgi:RNA polymerase sigma-70 factor (ECF subfamily)
MVMFRTAQFHFFKQPASSPRGDPKTQVPRSPALSLSPRASDEGLIGAIAQGDQQAMRLLYARHHVRVYRFVLRISDNATLAEDIVSEVFLDVWRQADGFKAATQASTWLLTIARNHALSAFKRRMDERSGDDGADTFDNPANKPQNPVHPANRSAIIQKCLSQLSGTQLELIDLTYYHEKSVEEVAQIIGVPTMTVTARMFEAQRRMAELLKAALFDGP